MTTENTPFGSNDVRPYDEADDTQGHAKKFTEPSAQVRPHLQGAEVEDTEGHARLRGPEVHRQKAPMPPLAEGDDTEGHRLHL